MKKYIIVLLFFLVHNLVLGQEKQRTLLWNAGPQNSWERDFAYSPLGYSGSVLGFSLGYTSESEKKIDEIYVHFARIPMENDFGAIMNGTHGNIITYTFYNAPWIPTKMMVGWSNNNALSVRNFQDSQNFNPRFDFHTSFGPAVRYQTFLGKSEQFRFSSQAHWQLIGFLFSASYVTSPPDPFLHERSTLNAFWQSIRFFQPFKQQDLGVLNQFFYKLSNGNEIGVGYRFSYISLENAQRSQRSSGHYFFQLNFKL